MGATNNRDRAMLIKRILVEVPIKLELAGQKAKPETKKAAAGVGMPINPLVCLVSMLNLANLNAENRAKANEAKGRIPPEDKLFCKLKRIKAGNTPKVTISAKESNSLPIGDDTFKSLAVNPSKKSKIAASQII